MILHISVVGRLDFKKLRRAASQKIDFEDEKHHGGKVSVENQPS